MSEIENIVRDLRVVNEEATDEQRKIVLRHVVELLGAVMKMVDDLQARSGLDKAPELQLEMLQILMSLFREIK